MFWSRCQVTSMNLVAAERDWQRWFDNSITVANNYYKHLYICMRLIVYYFWETKDQRWVLSIMLACLWDRRASTFWRAGVETQTRCDFTAPPTNPLTDGGGTVADLREWIAKRGSNQATKPTTALYFITIQAWMSAIIPRLGRANYIVFLYFRHFKLCSSFRDVIY